MKASTYVAFLRGVNVGGNTIISMEELRKVFSALGFAKVMTILASGNVVFEAVLTDQALLKANIEQKLKRKFGLEITVLLRTAEEIQALLAARSFQHVKMTPQTRLHLSFLPPDPEQGLKISERLNGAGFESFRLSKGEICSVVEITPTTGTTDLMKALEKRFGKNITTRTWNTVERIAAVLQA